MHELPELKLAPADGREVSGDTKLGGEPTFIQGDHTPECCGQRMALLAQLDGLYYPEAELPDSALVYVFLCKQCFEVHAELQCTAAARNTLLNRRAHVLGNCVSQLGVAHNGSKLTTNLVWLWPPSSRPASKPRQAGEGPQRSAFVSCASSHTIRIRSRSSARTRN
jgi:hypothetical protein